MFPIDLRETKGGSNEQRFTVLEALVDIDSAPSKYTPFRFRSSSLAAERVFLKCRVPHQFLTLVALPMFALAENVARVQKGAASLSQ